MTHFHPSPTEGCLLTPQPRLAITGPLTSMLITRLEATAWFRIPLVRLEVLKLTSCSADTVLDDSSRSDSVFRSLPAVPGNRSLDLIDLEM